MSNNIHPFLGETSNSGSQSNSVLDLVVKTTVIGTGIYLGAAAATDVYKAARKAKTRADLEDSRERNKAAAGLSSGDALVIMTGVVGTMAVAAATAGWFPALLLGGGFVVISGKLAMNHAARLAGEKTRFQAEHQAKQLRKIEKKASKKARREALDSLFRGIGK